MKRSLTISSYHDNDDIFFIQKYQRLKIMIDLFMLQAIYYTDFLDTFYKIRSPSKKVTDHDCLIIFMACNMMYDIKYLNI